MNKETEIGKMMSIKSCNMLFTISTTPGLQQAKPQRTLMNSQTKYTQVKNRAATNIYMQQQNQVVGFTEKINGPLLGQNEFTKDVVFSKTGIQQEHDAFDRHYERRWNPNRYDGLMDHFTNMNSKSAQQLNLQNNIFRSSTDLGMFSDFDKGKNQALS